MTSSSPQEETDTASAVQNALQGDLRAFERLMEKYGPIVTAYLHKRVHNVHDREELFQDTFLLAYSRLHSLKSPERFGPWLLTIAKRNCFAFYRNRKSTVNADELEGSESSLIVANLPDPSGLEVGRVILQCIAELSERLAVIVHLRIIEEMTSSEIAGLLSLRESTVRMRLKRGLSQIRTKLKKRGISEHQ